MSGTVHLNRKLVLEQAVRLSDGAGGYSESWQSLGMLWGALKAGTGREAGADFLTLSTVPWQIVVRAAPVGAASRPRPDQRFREGGRIFRILSVAEHDSDARFLNCRCRQEEVST